MSTGSNATGNQLALEPDRAVTDIDTAFVQQILHVAERKRETNVNHHRQADDLGAAVKVVEWVAFCHQ